MKTKYSLLLTGVVGLSSVGTSVLANSDGQTQSRETPQKPNIIFYLSDDQDKLDYGCYGNEKIHTPGVDRLAKEGVVFNNAFTGQAICAPSRSQLYTGNYPLKNGCFLNHVKSKDGQKSVTKYMRELGYEVILAGKSHVKPNSVYVWDQEWSPEKKKGAPRKSIPLDSIKSYFESAEKPFCMFITSAYPHGPYFDVDVRSKDNYKSHPYKDVHDKGEKKNMKRVAGYYRNVEEDNLQLENVLQLVDDYLDDNTLFIYSADHGTSGKYTVYDRGLNVPFVVRWPGVIKENSRSDVMVHYTDVLPTFMEIAGGKAPKEMDGSSFLSVLEGDNNEVHDYVYGVSTNQNIQQTSVFPSRMVRSRKYKYIRNFNSSEVVENNFVSNEHVNAFLKMGAEKFKDIPFEELYDIENDPYEQVNLAKKSKYNKIKKELVKEMYNWMKEQGDFLVKENYMPLLKPTSNHLDRTSKFKKVSPDLENTLTKKDYLILHY